MTSHWFVVHWEELRALKVIFYRCKILKIYIYLTCVISGCAKYHDFDYTTETYVLAAVGGRDSLAGEYPFMASFFF